MQEGGLIQADPPSGDPARFPKVVLGERRSPNTAPTLVLRERPANAEFDVAGVPVDPAMARKHALIHSNL
jgi:hypothetical protein